MLLVGAPEGIRTLDFNLGKWRGIHALCSPSGAGLPAGRAAQSGGFADIQRYRCPDPPLE